MPKCSGSRIPFPHYAIMQTSSKVSKTDFAEAEPRQARLLVAHRLAGNRASGGVPERPPPLWQVIGMDLHLKPVLVHGALRADIQDGRAAHGRVDEQLA